MSSWAWTLYGFYKRRLSRPPREWLAAVSAWCGGLTGKRVLDVGCDSGGILVYQIDRLYRPREVVGLNPIVEPRSFSATCRIEPGDVRKAAYPDGHFDVILSRSAFEHIHDMDAALAEMYRILKPGGTLYSAFGPIWSSCCGHHLWVWHRGRRYNYRNVILPPFCHLLMSEEEVFALLRKSYDEELARKLARYVFGSDEQNRLFFEDYDSAVRQSRFERLFFMGYSEPQISAKYDPLTTPALLEALKKKYPKHDNFMYEGISLLLRKPDGE
jgi:SAM-dependent methyltransferase